MQATAAPLTVEVTKASSKNARECAGKTAVLIKDILSQLKYEGNWTLVMQCRINKKADFKFQVTSRRNTAIVCRTKWGGNNTCWECLLVPPPGYLLEQVYGDLRTVPANGKMLRIPVASPKNWNSPGDLVLETPKPVLATTAAEIEKPVSEKPIEKVTAPPLLSKPVAEWRETRPIFTQQPLLPPKPTPKPEPVTKTESEKANYLVFGTKINSLADNEIALLHGLVAICMGITPNGNHILRQQAIKILVQELDLVDFVKDHPQYSDPVKAGTIIVRGLCDKGYLTRWPHPPRKQHRRRVRETTKGYLLTPYGQERLDAFKAKMPVHIVERLFHPEKIIIRQNVEVIEVPEEEELEIHEMESVIEQPELEEPATPATSTVEKIDILTPLVEEYQRLMKSLESYEPLGKDYENQKLEIEKQFTPIETRLDAIKLEKAALDVEAHKLENELKEKQAKLTAVLHEAKSWEELRNEESLALEAVKLKLKKLIG